MVPSPFISITRKGGNVCQKKVFGVTVLITLCNILLFYYSLTYAGRGIFHLPTTQKFAFAVTITKDGSFLDGAAVLAHAIKLHHSYLSYDLVAIVYTEAASAVPLLEFLGYKVRLVPVPLNISEIANQEYSQRMHTSGCCGESELVKLEAFRLTEYAKVMTLDLDQMVLDDFGDLLFNDKLFQFTYQIIYSEKDIAERKLCVNGGFSIIRPGLEHYDRLLEIVKRGNHTRIQKRGWENSGYGMCYGGETIQGLLSYYYHVLTEPSKISALDSCRMNMMMRGVNSAGDICRETPHDEIRLIHFAATCVKAWDPPSCYIGPELRRRYIEFRNLWWTYRREVEIEYGLVPVNESDAFPLNKYKPIFNRECLRYGGC